MPTQTNFFDESPSVDGPDYVALVIEWDELADDLERQIRAEQMPVAQAPSSHRWRTIGMAAGMTAAAVLGVAALVWIVKR